MRAIEDMRNRIRLLHKRELELEDRVIGFLSVELRRWAGLLYVVAGFFVYLLSPLADLIVQWIVSFLCLFAWLLAFPLLLRVKEKWMVFYKWRFAYWTLIVVAFVCAAPYTLFPWVWLCLYRAYAAFPSLL
ncbi:MAG: hypothetical protein KF886_18000 [Candidatus Hydrogenedentes bacterium]|nr:hypothetical protein [Candidatus Hydrogenedentota bacterium]